MAAKKPKLYFDCELYASARYFLTQEQKGDLLDALFDYIADGTTPNFSDKGLAHVFRLLAEVAKAKDEQYKRICEVNRQNVVNGRYGSSADTTVYDGNTTVQGPYTHIQKQNQNHIQNHIQNHDQQQEQPTEEQKPPEGKGVGGETKPGKISVDEATEIEAREAFKTICSREPGKADMASLHTLLSRGHTVAGIRRGLFVAMTDIQRGKTISNFWGYVTDLLTRRD